METDQRKKSGRLRFEQKKEISHFSEREEGRRQRGQLVGLMVNIWQNSWPLAAVSSVKEARESPPWSER